MANEICGEIFLVAARPYKMADNPNIEYYFNRHDVVVRGDVVNTKNEDELFVQIWCCGHGSPDWQSHVFTVENERIQCFPDFVPSSSLAGLREGDSFKMSFDGNVFRLTCNQLGHKYQEYGPFHKALKRLIESYDHLL